jgi:hypothetical protein
MNIQREEVEAVIAILVVLFFRSDMILKTNPSVISQDKSISPRPKIDLTPSEFHMAFGIFDKSLGLYAIDPTMFSIEVIQLDINYDPVSKQQIYQM